MLLMLVCCSFVTVTKAQSLPANTCGIVYTYDAAGNRTQRTYVCNNSTNAHVPVFAEDPNASVQQVSQLYPNPTTGRITISFSRPLKNARVILLDMAGHVVQQTRKSGNQIEFDLSVYGAGIYTLQVMDGSNPISIKIVKQ